MSAESVSVPGWTRTAASSPCRLRRRLRHERNAAAMTEENEIAGARRHRLRALDMNPAHAVFQSLAARHHIEIGDRAIHERRGRRHVGGEGEGGIRGGQQFRLPALDRKRHPAALQDRQGAVDAGKIEKAPLVATVAMLMRQSKSAMVARSGETAISTVSPPPFFHGICLYSLERRIRIIVSRAIPSTFRPK